MCRIALLAAAVIAWAAPVRAQGEVDPNNGFGPNDRPAFLIISLTDDFDRPTLPGPEDETPTPPGSPTLIVNLGTIVAGADVFRSRFETNTVDLADLVGALPDEIAFADLAGNEVTILGSFNTTGPEPAIHLVTPLPGVIPENVQEAFFHASPFFDELMQFGENPFPTTVEIAQFVVDKNAELETGVAISAQEILDTVFVTETILTFTAAPGEDELSTVEAEGVVFPHKPEERELFNYMFTLDEEGGFDTSVCLPVTILVNPGSEGDDPKPINLKSKGGIPIAILTTDDFDVSEIDPSTLEVGGVGATKYSYKDVDEDGDDDLIVHFSTPDLVDAGVLTENSTSIELIAFTEAGMCVNGVDAIKVVSKKK
jgi:hypothetical protein